MKVVLSRYRRALAALLAAAAAAFGLAAARPRPGGEKVLVAAHDLAAGAVLAPRDVTVRVFPSDAVPDGMVAGATGRTLSGAVRRGEPLTDARLRTARFSGSDMLPGSGTLRGGTPPGDTPSGGKSPGNTLPGGKSSESAPDGTLSDGKPPEDALSDGADGGRGGGLVAVPVRLADAAVVRLLRIGDRVDVLAARSEGPVPARTIAAMVPVVSVPKADEGTDEGALIVVRADRVQAAALARAAVDSRLSVTIVEG